MQIMIITIICFIKLFLFIVNSCAKLYLSVFLFLQKQNHHYKYSEKIYFQLEQVSFLPILAQTRCFLL